MEIGYSSPNYQIIEDKAYTEDGLLVYNVFVKGVPKQITNTEFFDYFKTFGNIIGGRLIKNTTARKKIGFVNYEDAVCAAKVLQTPNHWLKQKRVLVMASDSWNQPNAQCLAAMPAESTDNMHTDQEFTILKLNDDCLDIVFQHLAMQDQINLARCCRRLRDVFIMRARVQYKVLNFQRFEFLTLWQIRQFLEMAGPDIQKVGGQVYYNNFNRVIEFLGVYCVNIKSISIISERFTKFNLRKLLKNLHLVEELLLHDADLRDDCIQLLRKLKKLKSLSIDENIGLQGEHIKDLGSLEKLSLNGCSKISPRCFNKICKNLKNLTYLDIQECALILNEKCMQNMVKNLEKLETLKISSNYCDINCIAKLANLKHLHLYQGIYGSVDATLFKELAKHRGCHLETLHLHSRNCLYEEHFTSIGELKGLKELIIANNDKIDDKCLDIVASLNHLELLNMKSCSGFTTVGLMNLIKNCHKLRILNVCNCKQLTGEFVKKLLWFFNKDNKELEHSKPLRILAHLSGIPRFAVNTPEVESAADLVTISLDYEMDSVEIRPDDSDEDLDSDYDYYDDDIDDEDDDDDYDHRYMYYSDDDSHDDFDLNILAPYFYLQFQND